MALYSERDGSVGQVEYQSINFLPPYDHLSFEELRLRDYRSGLGPLSSTSPTQAGKVSSFCSPNFTGYAAAGVLGGGRFWNYIPHATRESANQAPSLGERMLNFSVGPDLTSFTVHERAIASRSELVRLALRHDWKEAQERCINMPDDDVAAFQTYQSWLYSGALFTRPSMGARSDDEYGVLVRAYLLGQKLMDSDFKDTIIDAIVNKLITTGLFDIRQTSAVYDNTMRDDALRRLWLDIYHHQGQASWLADDLDECDISAEFLYEFSRLKLSRQGVFATSMVPAYATNLCQYHEHTDGVCYTRYQFPAKIPVFRAPEPSKPSTALIKQSKNLSISSEHPQSLHSPRLARRSLPLEGAKPRTLG